MMKNLPFRVVLLVSVLVLPEGSAKYVDQFSGLTQDEANDVDLVQGRCVNGNNIGCVAATVQPNLNELTTNAYNKSIGDPLSHVNLATTSLPTITNTTTYDGLYLYNASARGDLPSVNKALAAGVDVNWRFNPHLHTNETSLHAAAQFNQPDIVNTLINAGADVDSQDERGYTPLHTASALGSTNAATVLIDHGASVGIYDRDGNTALLRATLGNHLVIVNALLGAGANINSGNEFGTPVLIASALGHLHLVEVLIAANADVNIPGLKGYTPVLIASALGNLHIVEALIATNADVNIPDHNGTTPVYLASGFGHLHIVEALIAANADVNIPNNNGATPAIEASLFGYLHVVEALIAANADVNITNNNGNTALGRAAMGSVPVLELLKPLHQGPAYQNFLGLAFENFLDQANHTALGRASVKGYLPIVEALLAAHANVNIRGSYDDFSALHGAATYNRLDIARVLLRNGADITIFNEWGDTPAQATRYPEMAALINSFTDK